MTTDNKQIECIREMLALGAKNANQNNNAAQSVAILMAIKLLDNLVEKSALVEKLEGLRQYPKDLKPSDPENNLVITFCNGSNAAIDAAVEELK